MKGQNRVLQVTLGIAVLVIWALILYRFTGLKNQKPEFVSSSRPRPGHRAATVLRNDSLFLQANYPDPFLGGTRYYEKTGHSLQQGGQRRGGTRSALTALPPGAVILPSVQYRGFSKNKDAFQRALLTVDGKNYTLLSGQKAGEVELQAIFPDSVQLVWKGHAITVLREQLN